MSLKYQKRGFYRLGDWDVAAHRIKLYGMSEADSARIDDATVDSAREFTSAALPEAAAREGDSSGLGFAMIHRGEMGTWLLVHWWAHEDIGCQIMALAAPGTSAFKSVADRPLHACVWEQVVIGHERDAWVEHMMRTRPDEDAYLADRLRDGRY